MNTGIQTQTELRRLSTWALRNPCISHGRRDGRAWTLTLTLKRAGLKERKSNCDPICAMFMRWFTSAPTAVESQRVVQQREGQPGSRCAGKANGTSRLPTRRRNTCAKPDWDARPLGKLFAFMTTTRTGTWMSTRRRLLYDICDQVRVHIVENGIALTAAQTRRTRFRLTCGKQSLFRLTPECWKQSGKNSLVEQPPLNSSWMEPRSSVSSCAHQSLENGRAREHDTGAQFLRTPTVMMFLSGSSQTR